MAVTLDNLTRTDLDNEFGTLYIAEIDGEKSVAVFTVNTPYRVINPGVIETYNDALDRIVADDGIAGIITYNEHGPFSNGFDLVLMKDIMELSTSDREAAEAQVQSILEGGQQLFDRLYTLEKPTVATVGGWCVGGGYEFALGHAYLIGTDNTGVPDPMKPWTFKLQLPEVKHVGLIPGWNGIPALIRRAVGKRLAEKPDATDAQKEKLYASVMKTVVEPVVLNGYGPDNGKIAVKKHFIDEYVDRDWSSNGNNGVLLEKAIYHTLDLADNFTPNTLEPVPLQPADASARKGMESPSSPADYANRCLYASGDDAQERSWEEASRYSREGIIALASNEERKALILKYIGKVVPFLGALQQSLIKSFTDEGLSREEVLEQQPWLKPWGV